MYTLFRASPTKCLKYLLPYLQVGSSAVFLNSAANFTPSISLYNPTGELHRRTEELKNGLLPAVLTMDSAAVAPRSWWTPFTTAAVKQSKSKLCEYGAPPELDSRNTVWLGTLQRLFDTKKLPPLHLCGKTQQPDGKRIHLESPHVVTHVADAVHRTKKTAELSHKCPKQGELSTETSNYQWKESKK